GCHQKRGDYEDSRSLAEDAVGRWPDVSGPDDIHVLDMRLQLANALRAQADYAAAREIDEDVYSRLNRLRGPGSEYTLIAARGLAADLRIVGDYADACRMEGGNLPLFPET